MSAEESDRPFASVGWKTIGILAGLAIVSLAAYLTYSAVTYRVGFPLDDAWIHQTYARNLAQFGQWAFIPGQPSGGSTSPLWSILLALGYLLHLSPYIWTYFLGWAAMAGLGILAEGSLRKITPAYRPKLPWVGAVFVFEWHLTWAAGSGMETLLYALVIAILLYTLLVGGQRWGLYGLLVGAAVWVRPDGVSLLGPLILTIWIGASGWRDKLRATLIVAAGFLVFFLPYLGFNRVIAGSWWPNTYYAKQAEYAALLQIPFVTRYLQELLLPLIGVGALLLPGVVLFVWNGLKRRSLQFLPPLLWLLGYLGLYAWRLPVTYQHGRYILPAMPIFFFLGCAGFVEFLVRLPKLRMAWVLSRVWAISLASLVVIFWGLGARAYATDVATVETEMVNTAQWVAANTAPGSLVAAHDIGAMGFFGQRDMVDLAGLISPDLIPIIRDEPGLAAYLKQKHVNYLVVFPDWYAHLTDGMAVVYQSSGRFAPDQGQANMRVYLWSVK
jgi:hypothetical protein